MNFKITYNSSLNKILVILFVFVQGISLFAVPELKSFNLRMGNSPRANRYSWMTINCKFINPDNREEKLEVRLVDQSMGAFKQKNVFSEIVSLPARTSINYSSTVMIENSEDYYLEIIYKGKQIGKSLPTLIKLVSSKIKPIPIFNDSDKEFGSFSRLPDFINSKKSAFFPANVSSDQWKLLKSAPCVVILKPDYTRFSSRKFQSIIDYVKQGGTLVFSHPDGIKEAMGTPLEPLLPIIPLRTRWVKRVPSLEKVIPGFTEFSEPVPFIESIPNGNGLSLVNEGEFPLIRYKKYGMGTVKAAVVPITKDSYNSTADWVCLLKLFFAHNNLKNDNEPAKATLDEMTGFSVPGVESVGWLILLYLVILLIPLGLGLYFRKTGYSWIAGGITALLFSLILLTVTTSESDNKKGVFLSFLEMIVPTGNLISGEGYYGLMASSDKTVDIKAKNASIIFSSIPPSDTKIALGGMNKGHTPTEIKTVDSVPKIVGMNLPVNSPRHFYSAFSELQHNTRKFELPKISYKKNLTFEPWKIPEGFSPYAAWLKFSNGDITLSINNNMITQVSGRKAFEADTILQSIKTFLNEGWKHNNPLLVLVENSDKTLHFDLKKFNSHGKRIIVLPVNEVFESELITIPREAISINPGNTSTRLVMTGNEFKPAIYSRSNTSYEFEVQISPSLVMMTPEKLELDFSYLNDSGNILIEPYLLGKKKMTKEIIPQKKSRRKRKKAPKIPKYKEVLKREVLKGKKLPKGRILFENLKGVFDPHSGKAIIGLKIRTKSNSIPLVGREKANTWSIKQFDIYVTGKIRMTEDKIIY